MKKLKSIIVFVVMLSSTMFGQTVNSFATLDAIATSNSSAQTIVTHASPQNASGKFHVTAVVRRISDGATKGWEFDGIFKRETGNATVSTTLLGNLGTSGDLLSLLLAAVAVDNDGSNVRVRVTGLSGTDMIWYVEMSGNDMEE